MRYLTLAEVLELHRRIVNETTGAMGVRELAALESALAQPRMTFDGTDLYPDLPAKAGALGHSLILGHPFLDGNKRVGHAALEALLLLNQQELSASIDEAERVILAVASGAMDRDQFIAWVRVHTQPLK